MANKNTSIYKIFWFISCCLWASHVAAVDVLNQGDVLNSSASLVSRNELFTLRFFNLSSNGDSNTNYSSLGIFYRDASSRRPFWVANRDSLITDNSGALVIDETGKLMITFNGSKAPLELFSGQSNNKVTAILQDDGNFALKSGEQILWQSFDFPTDSFLPGMKLGINYKTGRNWSLTSWLTYSRPAHGAFSLDWDPDERQLILRRRGVTFWTSGVLLENNTFENINLDGRIADHKFIEVSNEEGKYLTYEILRNQYTPTNWINITGLRLDYDGYMMDQSSDKVAFNADLCDGDSISSGCKRWEGPKCSSRGEYFWLERGYFLGSVESLFYDNANVSLSDCKDICWKNCTCVGTNFSMTANGTGCTFWYGSLEIARNWTSESSYYIIRPGPPAPPSGKAWIWTLIAAPIGIAIIWVIFFLFFMRQLRARIDQEKFLLELMNEAKEIEIEGKKGFKLKVYSVSSIMDATNCFSDENKLGEGGYGPVYKGLFDGQEIAVKRLSSSSRQGLAEFKNELIIVAKLQHTNLVQLLGFCIQGEEKMLVYEFMPHNSLDSYIFDQSKRKLFDWNKYFNIIKEIAQGILYLHKYSRLQIIHRDLKASNILLDNNMNPKIADFGMATIFTTAQSEANTNRIVGTRGYMAPEYAVMGIFSTNSDVFSYGVLVLEIVSGRRSNSNFNFDRPLNLIGYAWMLWKEDAALELMHPALRDSCSEDRVLRCINVALLCVEDNPLDRPSMEDVISMLTSEGVELPMPKQPAFCIERRVVEVNSSTGGMAENRTINNLTMSVMTGR